MNREEFIDTVLNHLFETFMPPGMEKAQQKLEERYESLPNGVNRKAWKLYEYSEEDRKSLQKKLHASIQEVIAESTQGVGDVEFGLISNEEGAELERTFKASDETQVLNLARRWAEDQGYSIEEPPSGSESIYDWRIDGRRLVKVN